MTRNKHRHHLIPKHMGGTDDEDNLTPPISIELHAEFHRLLWEDFGKYEDFIAWRCLSGRMSSEDARIAAAKIGQEKSSLYKESRKITGEILKNSRTFESCSAGGKTASKILVKWQEENREEFLANCSKIGKENSIKAMIPHEYMGEIFESKSALQEKHNMSNNKFYKLLALGEIKRLPKTWKVDKNDLFAKEKINEEISND